MHEVRLLREARVYTGRCSFFRVEERAPGGDGDAAERDGGAAQGRRRQRARAPPQRREPRPAERRLRLGAARHGERERARQLELVNLNWLQTFL